MPAADKYVIFMCYRRADGEWCAEWLYGLLSGQELDSERGERQEVQLFYDKTMPAGPNWRDHHLPALLRARAFILIATPGVKIDLSKPGKPDWVHEEIRWWLKHRRTAPIVVDATGEGNRWIPDAIVRRWPNLNRVEVTRDEVERSALDSNGAVSRIRERLLRGAAQAGQKGAFEELKRFKRLTRNLRLGLGAAVVASIAAATAAVLAVRYFEESQDRGTRLASQLETSARLVGEGLAYRGLATMDGDPALAFRLAFEGSSFDPASPLPNAVMRGALRRSPVWRRIVPPDTSDEALFFLAPRASPDDRIAADPELQFILTGSRTPDSLYLYRLADGELIDQRTLKQNERFVTPRGTVSRVFAIEHDEGPEKVFDFYLLDPQHWSEPAFRTDGIRSYACHSVRFQCYIIADDGKISRFSLLRGQDLAVEREFLAEWPNAQQIYVHQSAPVIFLSSPREVRRLNLASRETTIMYECDAQARIVAVYPGPSAKQLAVVTLSGRYSNETLTVEAVDQDGAHRVVSRRVPPFLMNDDVTGVLAASSDGRRIALTHGGRDEEAQISIIDLKWATDDQAFQYEDHGPLDAGREAATFQVGGLLALTPDGKYLYHASALSGTSGTTTTGGAIAVWDLSALEKESTLRPVPAPLAGIHAPVVRIAFDVQGARVLIWDGHRISHVYKRRFDAPPIFQQWNRLPEEHEQRFFRPDVEQWDLGARASVGYSLTDQRYVDLEAGVEHSLEPYSGGQELLDSIWLDPPEATFTLITPETVRYVLRGSIEREQLLKKAPARASAGEDSVTLGFVDHILMWDVRTLEELARLQVDAQPFWLHTDSDDGSGIWIYAGLQDGTYRAWYLKHAGEFKLTSYPPIRPERAGNAFAYRVTGPNLLMVCYNLKETVGGLVMPVEQPPMRVARYDFRTGEQLPDLHPPKAGWPGRSAPMKRLHVGDDGAWYIIFDFPGGDWLGVWNGPDDDSPKWRELGDGDVRYLYTGSGGSPPFAVLAADQSIRIVSLTDGSLLDEGEYPIGGRGLLPRVSTGTDGPAFVRDRAFRDACARFARGGLDSPLLVTNVDLSESTKEELEELSRALAAQGSP